MIRFLLSAAVAAMVLFPVCAHAQDAGLPLPDGAVAATATVTGRVVDDRHAGTTGALPGYSRTSKDGLVWFSRGGDYARPGPFTPKLGETGEKKEEQLSYHKNDYLVSDGPLSGVIKKLKGNAHVVVIVKYDLDDPSFYNKNVTVEALVGRVKKQVDVMDSSTNTIHTVLKDDEILITGVDGDNYTAVISPDRGLSADTPRINCEIPIKNVALASPRDPLKSIGRGLSWFARAIGGTAVRGGDDVKDTTKEILVDAGEAFAAVGEDFEQLGKDLGKVAVDIKNVAVDTTKVVVKEGEIGGLEAAAHTVGLVHAVAEKVADKTGRAHDKLEDKIKQVKAGDKKDNDKKDNDKNDNQD
jgi:hypothetical protein